MLRPIAVDLFLDQADCFRVRWFQPLRASVSPW
jgi:hypothetical protein